MFPSRWGLLALSLLSSSTTSTAQRYDLYEHPFKQGAHWPQEGLGLRGANVFHEDSISSIVVPDGYRLRIAEHDWLKGYQALIVGYCPFTGSIRKADGEGWDNEINSVSLEALADGWDKTPEFPTGIYYVQNPYHDLYLTVVGGILMFDRERFFLPPEAATYQVFLMRDAKGGGYTMFSVPSGENLRLRVDRAEAGTTYSMVAAMYEPETYNHFTMKTVARFAEVDGYEKALVTISPDQFPQLALSTKVGVNWGDHGHPHFRDNAKETNQQWLFKLVRTIDVPPMEAVETVLDDGVPELEKFDELRFVDGMSSPFQTKVKSIPFYMAPDRELPALEMRADKKYKVTLERQMKLLWPNGWVLNDSSEIITKTYQTSSSSTTEKSGETRFNTGFKHTTSLEAGLKGIATVTASLEFWADFGMTRSWLNSVTQSQSQTTEYKIPAHSKAAIFAVANKLTFRRFSENDPPEGKIILTTVVLEDQEPSFVARRLRKE
ncbi:MAG: hypothetical protein H6834_09920 [Planctomycetes bacterium]|nr:hypothetical protein [Planctomycetota bacterium]